MACDIWLILLQKNCGLPFSFVMGGLPSQKKRLIFDASSSYRYGVFCGELYFKISHSEVLSILVEKYGTELDDLFIAYRELLAALFPILAFTKNGRKKFVRVNSENINMVNR